MPPDRARWPGRFALTISVLAAIWGFAEATLFFVVPDVLLTVVTARRGMRAALPTSLLATLGALLGGALMFAWGARDAAGAAAMLDKLPAIGPAMIAEVADAMRKPTWPLAMVEGAFRGVPYKIYAVEASAAGLSAALFLAMSAIARLARFWATMALAAFAARLGRAWLIGPRATTGLVTGFWLVFYAFYWGLMPS